MKFNLDILRHYLLVKQGVLPENVTLETEFTKHLRMSYEDIRQMLCFVTKRTGVKFSSDSYYYLSDVFELVIHMMVRSVEVEISDDCFGDASDAAGADGWQEFLSKKFELPYHAIHLN